MIGFASTFKSPQQALQTLLVSVVVLPADEVADGHFALTAGAARDKDAVLYLVAKGGEAAAGKRGDDLALALLAVPGSSPNER